MKKEWISVNCHYEFFIDNVEWGRMAFIDENEWIYNSEQLKVEQDIIYAEDINEAKKEFENMVIFHIEDEIEKLEKLLELF